MTVFVPLAGIRNAETRRGDTLQRIAARELGDASRWPDLASLNELRPPWITDDPALESQYVLLAGKPILIPAPPPEASGVSPTDDDAIFGTDILTDRGRLQGGPTGDFALVRGAPNLTQASENRLATPGGSLIWHPDYGNRQHELIGNRNDPVANELAALFLARCLRQDPRISRVEKNIAVVIGDAIESSAWAIAVDGRRLPVGNAEAAE